MGVDPSATKAEIKAAYRALARKYHPDVNPGNKLSELKFKEIGEAYEILIDDDKRKQYNIIRGLYNPQRTQQNNTQQAKAQAKTAYKKPEENKKPENKASNNAEDDKLFNSVFSDILDGIFKRQTTSGQTSTKSTFNQPQPQKGEDITTEVILTITEAHNGTVRKVNVLHTVQCPKCKGKQFYNGPQCPECKGKGEISNFKKINVKIPPNVKEGSKIRIQGEGNKGLYGGKNGDLYLIVKIQKNSIFTYDDLNVLCDIPITPWEAAIGAEIQIPTIDGFVTMKIPPETSSGQKFKLAGQGLSDDKNGKKGDFIVTAYIQIPKNLTPSEINLYKELAKLRKFNPREDLLNEK